MPADATDTPIHTDMRATAIRVNCPHCGHPLDVVPINTASPPPSHRPPTASPPVWAGRTILGGLVGRLVPLSEPVGQALGAPPSPIDPDGSTSISGRRWMLLGVVLLMAAVVVTLILWGRPEATAPAPRSNTPAMTPAANGADIATQEAAIRDTLTRYNAAETEVAALLLIDPIRPYLAPEGPFAARRAAELAERQRRNAPHRSILVRWGIGAITVNGDTATAVTQETWSNQEAGAVAPEQATVRVTYTLRWEAKVGRWLIVETSQMPL